MASGAQIGRKSLIGLISSLAWLVLLVAFLATAVALSVNNLNHVGNTASSIVNHLSKNQSAINSLLDQFKKNADPKTVSEIDKNRAKIETTIASLGGSKEFQNSLAATLNTISQAILNGSSSVKVDFTKLATLVADKVNEASKSTVINKKELAKLKPQTLDLAKQSKVVVKVRNKIKEVTLAWLLWLVLLGVIFLLKGWKVLRTAGWQLFSIGIVFLLIRYGTPFATNHVLSNSSWPVYQRDLIPQVFNALTGPIVKLAIVVGVGGILLAILDKLLRDRLRVRKRQISPSVDA